MCSTVKMMAISASHGLDRVNFVHRHICDRIFLCTSNCTENNAIFKGCASNQVSMQYYRYSISINVLQRMHKLAMKPSTKIQMQVTNLHWYFMSDFLNMINNITQLKKDYLHA